MADFLVLEEDGTSHILTETSDSLILEESSPQSRSASFTADAFIDIAPAPPPTGYGTWRTGVITLSGTPGSVAVTGLGGSPDAVFFFGTNWLTEDTAVTTAHTGLFRGMAARKFDAPGTIVQSGASIVPAGDANHISQTVAINQLDTSGNLSFLYVGQVTSFDVDGFSVNFNPAPSGYKVVWVALMNMPNCAGRIGTASGTPFSFGWKAGTSVIHGAWLGPDTGDSNQTKQWYGGAGYPGTNGSNWEAVGLTALCFPLSTSAQYLMSISTALPPGTIVTEGGHFLGPFLIPSDIVAVPTGAGLTDFQLGGDSTNGGMVVAWDDEDSRTRPTTPATSTGGTTTVSGIPFRPGLLMGYNISNETSGQGTGGRGAAGLSVVADGFEWCATVDGSGTGGRGSFQSFQRGFADAVNGTDVHAGTVVLTDDGFVMTTQQDDLAASAQDWHIFGHPDRSPAKWIPHIYRRVLG